MFRSHFVFVVGLLSTLFMQSPALAGADADFAAKEKTSVTYRESMEKKGSEIEAKSAEMRTLSEPPLTDEKKEKISEIKKLIDDLKTKAYAYSTSNDAFPQSLKGKDERSCLLNIAKNALGLFGNYKESLTPPLNDWGKIQLEEDVYYIRHAKNDLYTIYGRAENLNPKEFKIQIRAQWFPSSERIPYCKVGKYTDVIATNSSDTVMMTRAYHAFANVMPLSELTNSRVELEAPKISNTFKLERTYSPISSLHDKSKIQLNIDPYHVGGAVVEAGLWVFANKFTTINKLRVLRIVRKMGKVFVVAEQSSNLLEAYQIVDEGGEPKMVPVTDSNLLDRLKNAPGKMYELVDGQLRETGVLIAPTSFKDVLEGVDTSKVGPIPDKNDEHRRKLQEKLKLGEQK